MKNRKNFLSKAITLLMTLALLVGMVSTSALAADYTVKAGDTNATVTMNKYLLMDKAATVPTVAFGFTITPGVPAEITVDGKTQKILAGTTGGSVGNAKFAPSEAGMTEHTTLATDDKADIGDPMDANKKYYKQTADISLVGMVFSTPGVYRYTITEASKTPTDVPGVGMDTSTTRVLDVYVGYKNEADQTSQTLSIIGTVLHNTTTDTLTGTTYDSKKKGFTNPYTTMDLTLNKTVAGNQGYRSQYFPFTIKLGGTGVLGSFTITKGDGTPMDTTTEIPGFAGQTNPNTIAAGTTGVTVYLKHGETIKINGLPKGATYEIIEDKATCGDYTTGITDTNGGTIAVPKVNGTMNAADAAIVYTNTREGTVPTGILLDIWPYILIVAVAAVALIVLMSKKRKHAARY